MLKKMIRGFTLIEMLLVMVIISIIVFAGINYLQRRTEQMRVDKASMQMQQILNAAMSFYVSNGRWPKNMSELLGRYLPNVAGGTMTNPWGAAYLITETGTHDLFYVWSKINSVRPGVASLQAAQIAGSLPLSFTSTSSATPPANTVSARCTTASTACFAVAAVNIPGQNLNNANAVNFAGLYHHGACVPVPTCPVDASGNKMTPQIFVIPVSVSGVNDPASSNPNVYPISSFTAYAVPNTLPTTTSPPACTNSTTGSGWIQGDTSTQCQTISGNPAAAYWRVCLQVVTQKGDVQNSGGINATDWGRHVTLMAVTRCSVPQEPSGSTFSVFSN